MSIVRRLTAVLHISIKCIIASSLTSRYATTMASSIHTATLIRFSSVAEGGGLIGRPQGMTREAAALRPTRQTVHISDWHGE